MHEELKKARPEIQALLDKMGLVLFDMKSHRMGKQLVFTVFIDHPSRSISILDCEQVSRALGCLLDGKDLFQGSYLLEVSSPGAERILRGPEDYQRFTGYLVKAKLKNSWENRSVIIGVLVRYEEPIDQLTIRESETQKDAIISVRDISEIRLRLEV